MTDQEIRLKFGELNASEMLLSRALVEWHEREIAALKAELEQTRLEYSELKRRLQAADERAEKAHAELAALRQPILADDGKSLESVYVDAFNTHWQANQKPGSRMAGIQAVADVVLAQAVRRMEAVPVDELEKAYWDGNEAVDCHTAIKRVRASLIAAVKGEGQAQSVVVNEPPQDEKQPDLSGESEKQTETAWIPHDGGPCPLNDEEVEEWQVKWKDDDVDTYKNLNPSQAKGWDGCIISYRVLKWKPGFGPEAKAEQDPYVRLKAAHAAGKIIQMKLKNEPDDTWDDIPDPGWGLDPDEYRIKPEPAQSTMSIGWTPTIGDTVRLKSGGPAMTVTHVDPKSLMCAWMNANNELQVEPITTLCLEPAQP